MRKTFTAKKGNKMISGSFGKYGPYALGSVKLNKNTNVKASIGTKGKIVGAKYVKKNDSVSISHNLTTGNTSTNIRIGKTKLRFRL
ncbi:hypothetical protein GOV05_03105 [Candidatus Woesearchaeota archaeon]|nr:hypothetical protein [Candidatus Woesearchaeota archaeon]